MRLLRLADTPHINLAVKNGIQLTAYHTYKVCSVRRSLVSRVCCAQSLLCAAMFRRLRILLTVYPRRSRRGPP
jgi:hypothetical protein